MIWDILVKKIEDAGLATTGQSLFLNEMPADIDVGIMLKEPLAGIAIDPHAPGYYTPGLQVVVRHKDPEAGAVLAAAVQNVLTVEAVETHAATASRGAAQINIFYPKTLPIRYPRLDGHNYEWSLNFVTSFTIHQL